jgi:hypothetical protein
MQSDAALRRNCKSLEFISAQRSHAEQVGPAGYAPRPALRCSLIALYEFCAGAAYVKLNYI